MVSTFGTKKPQNLEMSVVEFTITTKEGLPVILHANVLQQITSPIRRGPLPQAHTEFLQAIAPDKLADNIPVQLSSATIDILLGSDYFWNIVDGGRIVLPSGLLLVSSKLGYILTGKYPDPTEKSGCDKRSLTS